MPIIDAHLNGPSQALQQSEKLQSFRRSVVHPYISYAHAKFMCPNSKREPLQQGAISLPHVGKRRLEAATECMFVAE